ncbi:MAG: hypothetical protein NZ108_05445, partial [Bacteroidia bacterium]|nr:hypothetical protein [Bacteroidia bacterium]
SEIQAIWVKHKQSDIEPVLLPLFLVFSPESLQNKLQFLQTISASNETILAFALLNGLRNQQQELPLP